MKDRAVKIVIMGDGGTGKSCIVVNFIQKVFVDKYDPTIEDSYRKSVNIDGEDYMVEILDTAGTEQFSSMRDIYIKGSDGIILVFSVTSMASVCALDDIFMSIQNNRPDIPVVLAANKCDMVQDITVPHNMCNAISKKFDTPHIRTSAKTSEGVLEIFNTIISLAIESKSNKSGSDSKILKHRKCIIM